MTIELLYRDKSIVSINNIDQISKDVSNICSVQIINHSPKDIESIVRIFDIDTTILNNSNDIEISSHYLETEQQLSFNFSFPYFTPQNRIEEVVISFILKENIMFSFMAINFEQFIPGSKKQEYFENIKTLPFTYDSFLQMMIEIVPDYFADLTESMAKNIKTLYFNFQKQEKFTEHELDDITAYKFNNIILKESLNEFRRILHLLRKSKKLTLQLKEIISLELTDLSVINEYVQSNFERLDDLKDYISNKIDLEQNRIFKVLTMITTCISLPMLVAGFYGMNFKFMPELEWEFGYQYVIGLILISFILPFLWFKRKKWLK